MAQAGVWAGQGDGAGAAQTVAASRTPLPPSLWLALALGIYGGFSAPAPEGLGVADVATAGCLAMAVGVTGPAMLLTGAWLSDPRTGTLGVLACVSLAALVWPPLFRGAAMGWTVADMVRDLIPLAFLFLPVLFVARLEEGQAAAAVRHLAWALALAGFALALRWWTTLDVGTTAVGLVRVEETGLFVLKSAAVPFAAAWLLLAAVDRLARHRLPDLLLAPVLALAGLVCLLALAAALHRAASILVVAVVLAGAGRHLLRSAGAALLLTCAVIPALLLYGFNLSGLIGQLMEKTQAVGVNSRLDELAAIMGEVMRSPAAFLFGDGWGALLSNPAAGGQRVSFTHNVGSYFLFKTGAVGVLAVTVYLAAMLASGSSAWRRHPDLVLAALPSLLAGLFLHTSYKYLCFGALLTLLLIAARDGASGPLAEP